MLVFARVFVISDENVGPAGDAASRAAPVLHVEFQAVSIRENGVLGEDGLGNEVNCLGVHRWLPVEHIGNAQARLLVDRDAPQFLVDCARASVGNMPVSRKLMREGAHIACALHIVLTAQPRLSR